jgi:hypothetical protein
MIRESVNILFLKDQWTENSPFLRSELYYFSLLDDAPSKYEVIIERIPVEEEDYAAYIIDHVHNNPKKFKTGQDVINFFYKALEYHRDANRYKEAVNFPVGVRFDVLKRDGYKCIICGNSAKDGSKLEVDHIIPRSLGGGNEPNNLQTLCFKCNRGRSNKKLMNFS